MGLGTHLWSLGPILHPETCVLVLDPYFGCPPCTKCAPGANRAPWCTGARSSVHPRRPEHAPRCTRPTCERRSLRPEVVCGHRVADGTLHAHDAPSRCTHVGRAGCTPRRPSKVRAPGQGSHLANGAHFREGGCAPRRGVGGRGGFARGSRFAKYTLRQAHNGCDHTSVSAPDPIRTPQLSALGPE
ncbi:hypothetical protein SUGI_1518080 [Cryptomeria japonica]|uniref:Uncharacterized protein n=1 Tax=Cryptomeria japonica TaxID=3369 RepID=A0AAD3RSB2_CRYJA|nr:hypothetical protein SUGI_1518080 [Cryptomeria japonica]